MPSLSALWSKRIIRWAVVAVVAAAAALSLYQGIGNALEFSQDFQWDAAKALCMRLDPYELSLQPEKALNYPTLEEFYRMFTDRGLKQKMEANQFPSLLLLLAPMTLLPPQAAKTVWCILNLLFTAGIILLLRKTFFEKTDRCLFAVMMLVMIAGTPYRNQLGVGQHTLFAFFFFILAVYVDTVPVFGSKTAESIAIAAALSISYFKYTLTAPLALYFLFRKRYKEFAVSVIVHIVMTIACAVWLQKSVVYMIKAPLQVASALLAEGGIDLGAIFRGWSGYGIAFVAAVLLTYTALRFPKGRGNILFGILILWSLVLTYHRTYDFFVLSAAAALFTGDTDDSATLPSGNISRICYVGLVFLVYFVLRIFDENMASKAVTAVVYYAYMLFVTYGGINLIRMESHG